MTALKLGMLLLMASASMHAQDLRDTLAAALRNLGSTNQAEATQVEFAAKPSCNAANPAWRVKNAHFDKALRAWVVETSCVGSAVPLLAIVRVDDPGWLRANVPSRKGTPILVRAGEQKKLAVEFSGVRITEQVVCLRSGRAGDVIGVRSRGRKVVHLAMVSETGNLVLAGTQ